MASLRPLIISGIGILKGLFDWTGKYQRPPSPLVEESIPQTLLTESRELTLREGPEGPIFHEAGPVCCSLGTWGLGNWTKGERRLRH